MKAETGPYWALSISYTGADNKEQFRQMLHILHYLELQAWNRS